MKPKNCFIILFAMVAGAAGHAETSLTLSQAIDEARTSNPSFIQAELEAKSAAWGKLAALSGHLPHLSVSGSYLVAAQYEVLSVNFGGPISFPAGIPQTLLNVDASLNLFDGLATYHRYQAAARGAEAADLSLAHMRLKLEEDVTLRFYQALGAQKLLDVSDQNIKSLEDHLQLAGAMVSSGYSTRFDVLRLEAQLEEARADRLSATDNVVLSRRMLSQAMGLDDDSRVLSGNLPVPSDSVLPSDIKWDLSQRNDLQAVAKLEEASSETSAAAHGFWFPAVSVFGEESFYQYGNFNPAILPTNGFPNSYSAGFRLMWNIFDGGLSLAQSQRASLAKDIETQTKRRADLGAADDLETWKRKYKYSTVLYQARLRAVEKSDESVRLARIGFKAGTRTNSESLDAELELFRARAGVVRAQLDALEALGNLELAVGHRFQ